MITIDNGRRDDNFNMIKILINRQKLHDRLDIEPKSTAFEKTTQNTLFSLDEDSDNSKNNFKFREDPKWRQLMRTERSKHVFRKAIITIYLTLTVLKEYESSCSALYI